MGILGHMTEIDQTLKKAVSARNSGKFAEAKALYLRCLPRLTDTEAVRLEIALCSLALKEHAETLRFCDHISDPQRSARASLLRARAHMGLGEADFAAEAFDQALDSGQLSPQLKLSTALTLGDLSLNQFGDAAAAARYLGSDELLKRSGKAQEAELVASLYLGGRSSTALAKAFTAHAETFIGRPAQPPAKKGKGRRAAAHKGEKPRIGILSTSLAATPVGFLTLGAWRALKDKAELIFFDRKPRNDFISQALRECAHSWVECANQDEKALFESMREANLDALIDCSGWTDLTGLSAVSMRPVARQFKWVGGQALTTGLSCFDGFLSDQWQISKACESLYVEPILRFSGSYITYTPPPYFDFAAAREASASQPVKARDKVYAIVSNPAKISPKTLAFVKSLKPKKLLLIDYRWRFARTRNRLEPAIRESCGSLEYLTPTGHREYLSILRDSAATFIDTRPYSMGLTAIELLLMDKTLVGPKHGAKGLMCERHSLGHQKHPKFFEYESQAAQLLKWCRT